MRGIGGTLIALAAVWGVACGPRPTPTGDTPSASVTSARTEPRLGAQATLSSAVVQAMVAGNAALVAGSAADLARARVAFEQAVALDERYAPAHAGLARTLVLLAELAGSRPSEVLPKAIEHGDLAVELDPASALGWYALARAEVLWTRDWSRAELHYRRAMALAPADPVPASQLAELLAALERSEEARDQIRVTLALDPSSASLLTSAGKVHYLTGDPVEALRHFTQARAAGGTDAELAPWLVRTHVALGMTNDALEAARKAGAPAGVATAWVVGFVHAQAGRRQEAEAVLAAMGRQVAQVYVPALGFAYVRAALGQRDEALSFVETGVREHSPGSELLLVDPIFAALRSEARFRAALDELKLGGRR